jgi:hypothetical protein
VTRGSPAAVVAALGRVEARRLATSVTFVIGLVLTGVVLLLLVQDGGFGQNLTVSFVRSLGLVVYPLAGLTLLATNRATNRSRRSGTEELFTSTPTNPALRTGGNLFSVSVALVVASVLVIGLLLVVPLWGWAGELGHAWIAEVLTGVVLVAGAGAIGVLLARWLPPTTSLVVALLTVVAIGVATLLLERARPFSSPSRFFGPWASPEQNLGSDFVIRPSWSHLLYLVGVVTLFGTLAIARTAHGRGVVAALVAGALLTAGGAWFQSRPVSDEAASRIAARIENPAVHQTCRAESGVRACAYSGYTALFDDWIEPAVRVRAALPAAAREDEYVISQRVGRVGAKDLDPAVVRRLDVDTYWSDDGVEHPGFTSDDHEFAFALLPAQASVGLPLRTGQFGQPCHTGNQARAAVALWLAAQALDRETARKWLYGGPGRGQNGEDPYAGIGWGESLWPNDSRTDIDAPIAWAEPEIDAARQLFGLPRAQVLTALHADWAHLTDPATPTAELVASFGLRPVTPVGVPRGLAVCS